MCGIHRRPVNSPHKGPVTRKMFPFDDVIVRLLSMSYNKVICVSEWGSLGPLLLTWINFNPGMNKFLHSLWSVGWSYLSIPKFQRCNHWSLGMDKRRWSLGMEKYHHPTLYNERNYLFMPGLKLIHVSKRDPWYWIALTLSTYLSTLSSTVSTSST